MDVLGYLNSKGVQVKHDAGPNDIHTACFFCNEDDSKRGRLYINVDPSMSPPGLFQCHLCGESGAINKIRRHFGDPPLDDNGNDVVRDKNDKPVSSLRLLKAAADYYHETLTEYEDKFDYLYTKRGLSTDTIVNHKLGWADGGLGNHLKSLGFSAAELKASNLIKDDGSDFFINKLTIPYFFQGNVLQIRGREIGSGPSKYLTPPGDEARLFNVDAARNQDKVIITEGEFDALTLEQLGFAAVGVPGANAWKDNWSSYLGDAKRVYLCFDRDQSGAKGFEKVSESLAKSTKVKIRQILMPMHGTNEAKNDPSEWIVGKGHTKSDFEELMRASEPPSLLVSLDDAFAEWELFEGAPTRNRISLGFNDLDKKIDGGVQPGQVIITLAKTGVGKTSLLVNSFNNLIYKNKVAMAKDRNIKPIKILFISLEQTRNEWFDRALKVYSFYNPPMPKTIRELDHWRTAFAKAGKVNLPLVAQNISALKEFYQDHLMMVDKNKVTEEEFHEIVEDFKVRQGRKPDLIAVDYLGYWARAFPGEGYERTTAAVMKLKEIGKDVQVPIHAPHQVSRASNSQRLDIGSGRDAGAVEETADFLLALQREMKQEIDERARAGAKGDGMIRGMKETATSNLYIDVLKSRHGGAGGDPVVLTDASMSLAWVERVNDPKNKKFIDRCDNERKYYAGGTGENLNDYILRHASDHYQGGMRWRDVAFEKLESKINANKTQ